MHAAIHLMPYINQKYNSRLGYHPSYPDFDHSVFRISDWSEFLVISKRQYL